MTPRCGMVVWLCLLLPSLPSVYALSTYTNCDHSSSQFCSVGKVGYYYGEIESSPGYKKALETVSYKKELILVTTYGSFHLEFFFQLHSRLLKLGFAHFLALSMQEDGCQQVKRVSAGAMNVSCSWDETPMHKRSWGGGPLLWHLRWRFIARAARLGYNILSLDSDFGVFQDPYPYLKGPLMKDMQMFAAEEGSAMNGGFAYIQNVRPDGPIAWIFHRTTEVPLRWMDDDLEHIMSFGKLGSSGPMCVTFDQCFLADAIESTVMGFPVTRCVMLDCTPESFTVKDGGRTYNKTQVLKTQWDLVWKGTVKNLISVRPASWPVRKRLPEDTRQRLRMIHVSVPNYNSSSMEAPPEFGGPAFSRKGGKYTDHYFKQLKGDCPDCPWWKDEKQEDAEAAADTNETFSYAPTWFVDSATYVHFGYIEPPDQPGRQVMLHYHIMHPKGFASRVYRVFDWELSKFLHSAPGSERSLAPGPYLSGPAPARVIMYPPGLVDLSRTRDQTEFRMLVAALVQLAHISKRAVVYPDVPCAAKWAHKDGDDKACTHDLRFEHSFHHLYPYGMRVDPYQRDNNTATKWAFASNVLAGPACMGPNKWIQGMLYVEWEHWVVHDCPENTCKPPDGSNSINFEGLSSQPAMGATTGGGGGEKMLMDEFVVMDVEAVTNELDKFEHEPILYITRPVSVDVSGDAQVETDWRTHFKRMLRECEGLKTRE